MLRIAVPNKGSLSEPATTLLREAGYKARRDSRELVLHDSENDVEFFFLRPRDIAVYVGSGTVDAGITGRDLLIDSGVEAVEHRPLGFARSRFHFAAPPAAISSVEGLAGKRIATSYRVLVEGYLAERGVSAEVIRLDGAIESTVQLGVADAVADVVETGSTLRAAGLATFGDVLLESEAVLIRPTGDVRPGFDKLDRRILGVLTAREYVLMDFDIPVGKVDAAAAIAPGLESPTVSPLHDGSWAAVRVMVKRRASHRIMDELQELGARGILVTQIHATRL
ncbi:ATP phosphoribosyltransferase [Serinibacter salmoneus]|uniref:ATP phosphoribosyltransferase n=1 Tax=Serinibacter salmoneus TaxID=556530 RepID=A0A2A9D135_9MICO|nr:ATP phosphoribosyltransferase [Serinibacter salmoneus]PFG19662.1 ATP phosphoribosyltransferase (homohexameric) [Serinibacter salmoneus]